MEKIIHQDCMPFLREMEDDSVNLILTDIPFGQVNRSDNGLRTLTKHEADVVTFDLMELIDEFCRITKGSIYVFCSTEQVSEIRSRMVENGLSTRHCIWEKTNPSPMNGEKIWLSSIENIIFGKKKGAVFNEFCASPVFRFPAGQSKIHPTQKPLGLIKRLMLASSEKEDMVLDPFMGSGTTVVAAHELGRHCIGIEIKEEYFEEAKKRIEEAASQISFFDI